MSKIIASVILAVTVLSGVANAGSDAGNAQRETARQHQITPHGVFDAN